MFQMHIRIVFGLSKFRLEYFFVEKAHPITFKRVDFWIQRSNPIQQSYEINRIRILDWIVNTLEISGIIFA